LTFTFMSRTLNNRLLGFDLNFLRVTTLQVLNWGIFP